jgi:hypothetical protein
MADNTASADSRQERRAAVEALSNLQNLMGEILRRPGTKVPVGANGGELTSTEVPVQLEGGEGSPAEEQTKEQPISSPPMSQAERREIIKQMAQTHKLLHTALASQVKASRRELSEGFKQPSCLTVPQLEGSKSNETKK